MSKKISHIWSITSLPAKEEWIEILCALRSALEIWSLPAKEEWIEMFRSEKCSQSVRSLPAKEEWIEIFFNATLGNYIYVSSCKGRVD